MADEDAKNDQELPSIPNGICTSSINRQPLSGKWLCSPNGRFVYSTVRGANDRSVLSMDTFIGDVKERCKITELDFFAEQSGLFAGKRLFGQQVTAVDGTMRLRWINVELNDDQHVLKEI
ncbi:hypothetical protein M3Y99_00752200 [Aphelenchoides fujianensis]|nr:hypothetical protein M3Y99_00752200 [Aphelenchoides fujianensis]